MLTALAATTAKELKVLIKDPGALAALFLMPLIFILVMSLALSSLYSPGQSSISVAVADADGGPFGAALVNSLAGVGGLALVTADKSGAKLDRAAAEAMVTAGKAQVALIVPAGIGEALRQRMIGGGPMPQLDLVADPTLSPQVLAPLHGAVSGFAEQAAFGLVAPLGIDLLVAQVSAGGTAVPPALADALKHRMAGGIGGTGSLVAIRDALPVGIHRERGPNSVEQNVPAYTLFGLFFISTRLAASIFEERQIGTFRRLLAAPVSRATLMAGKLAAYVVVNLVQVLVLFGFGVLVLPHLGVPPMSLGAHPENLVVITLAVSLAATSLGLLLAAIARTEAQANGIGLILILVSAMLGGVMVPRFVMPGFMQHIGWISPHAWGLEAYQDVLMRDGGFSAILPDVAVLLLFAAIFFSIAVWRFRWD
jgi:ABC-2 type transport system permease protein